MKKLFLLALACVQASLAQNAGVQAPAAQDMVRKVIEIKYADPRQVQHLVELFDAHSVPVPNGIAIRGTHESVEAVETAIRKIDVPQPAPPNVDLTVYMISASAQTESGSPLPAELEPVVKQFRNVFNYKTYNLTDSFVLRTRPGERGMDKGVVPGSTAGSGAHYEFTFKNMALSGDKDHLIHVEGLNLSLSGSAFPPGFNPGIATDLDIREGQKVVVGKASLPDSALLLVLSAKIVD